MDVATDQGPVLPWVLVSFEVFPIVTLHTEVRYPPPGLRTEWCADEPRSRGAPPLVCNELLNS